jgi:AP-4 complex subunit epsilon-1
MTSKIGVATIHEINQEEIFVGKLMSTPFFILIRLKFEVLKVEIKIMTKVYPLSKSALALLQ